MSELLKHLLVRFLTLGIEGEDDAGDDAGAGDDVDDAGDAGAEDDGDTGTGDADLDALIDHAEDPPPDKGGRENAAILEARRRAQAAEQERDTERAARQAAEARITAAAAAPSADQQQWTQEESRLKAADCTELERWQIQSNRTIRQSNANANQAVFQAADLRDRAAFERIEITKPGVYKQYAERVEKKIMELRSQGQFPARLELLKHMIGDDMMNGKIGAKPAKAKPAGSGQTKPSGVDRGRTSGARSDVSTKQRQTDREKLRARLENVPI